jgi:hypothetical protein
MRSSIGQLSFLLAALVPTPALAQFGFQDGGFDIQGASLPTYCHFPACPSGAWSGSIAGIAHSGEPDLGSIVAPSWSAMAFIQMTGTISQTFTATETKRVRLVWLEADRPSWGGQTYVVTVNGASVGSFSSSSTTFQQRMSSAFDIVAGTGFTIVFAGQSATEDRTSLIDSVRLVVDEPSTTSYTYDSLGRLTGVTTTGGSNNGINTSYTFDKAGNRTNATVTGAQP